MKPIKNNLIVLWIKVCCTDDLKAFEELFYQLNYSLIKFRYFFTENKEISEEIVTDIFVQVWKNRKNLISIVNPESFLLMQVLNFTRDNHPICTSLPKAFLPIL